MRFMNVNYSIFPILVLGTLLFNQKVYARLPEQAHKPVLVTTKDIKDVIIYPLNEVPASTLSLNDSVLSSEIKGRVIMPPKEVGSNVHAGETISMLECTDYESELKRVRAEKLIIEADLKLTTWQLERTKKLTAQNNASEEVLRKHEATQTKLKAQLLLQDQQIELAKSLVARCNIIAPFDGVILSRMTSIGEYATPGTKIIQLLDTQNLELEARLHKNEVEQLEKAEEISFKTSSAEYPVTVRTILPSKDPKYRTQIVRLNFQKETPLPGAAGRLMWKSIKPAIPAEYIRQYNKHLGFFIADNDQAKFVPLENAIEGQPVTLTEDIGKPNIIINGRYVVEDGTRINIQPET